MSEHTCTLVIKGTRFRSLRWHGVGALGPRPVCILRAEWLRAAAAAAGFRLRAAALRPLAASESDGWVRPASARRVRAPAHRRAACVWRRGPQRGPAVRRQAAWPGHGRLRTGRCGALRSPAWSIVPLHSMPAEPASRPSRDHTARVNTATIYNRMPAQGYVLHCSKVDCNMTHTSLNLPFRRSQSLAGQFEQLALGPGGPPAPGQPPEMATDPGQYPRPLRPGSGDAPPPFDQHSCPPSFMRMTVNAIPSSQALKARRVRAHNIMTCPLRLQKQHLRHRQLFGGDAVRALPHRTKLLAETCSIVPSIA